jgi:hypothetical protein
MMRELPDAGFFSAASGFFSTDPISVMSVPDRFGRRFSKQTLSLLKGLVCPIKKSDFASLTALGEASSSPCRGSFEICRWMTGEAKRTMVINAGPVKVQPGPFQPIQRPDDH